MNQYQLKSDYENQSRINRNDLVYNNINNTITKYQSLINEMPHWIWETDNQLKIISSNFQVSEITGYTIKEVIGVPITDLLFCSEFNGIDIDSLCESLIYGKKQKITLNHCIRHRDQSIRYLKTVIFSYHYSDNTFPGLIGITHDQTMQVFAEKALKESEKKLQFVLSNLSEVVFMINATGLVTFISPAVKQLLGIKSNEILNKSFFEICDSLGIDNYRDLFNKFKKVYKKRQVVFNYEIEININGKQKILDVSVKILYNSKGNFEGATGVIRNITKRRRAEANMRAAFNGAIDAIALIVEQRDNYTSGHQYNVAKLSVGIAQELELNHHRIEGLRIAAMLHDVGKMSIPIEILNRPSNLSNVEWRIIKMHPQLGANILKHIPFPWNIARFVEEHHERIDGSGYPLGKKGNEISLEARIIGVADTLDSIINHRPYKLAQDITEALETIKIERGIKFDFDIVNAIFVLFQKGFFNQNIKA